MGKHSTVVCNSLGTGVVGVLPPAWGCNPHNPLSYQQNLLHVIPIQKIDYLTV